jgi:hypothetical protein
MTAENAVSILTAEDVLRIADEQEASNQRAGRSLSHNYSVLLHAIAQNPDKRSDFVMKSATDTLLKGNGDIAKANSRLANIKKLAVDLKLNPSHFLISLEGKPGEVQSSRVTYLACTIAELRAKMQKAPRIASK